MTIIGQAELEIRAVGNHFAADVNQSVKPGMAAAAVAGEAAASRTGRAFKLAFSSVAQSAGGAFAPVTDTLAHLTGVMDELHAKGNRPLQITAAGSALLGAGAGLQAWASQEQAAQQQLQVAIESTGHSWDDYSDRIEKAVKQGERHGVTANTTLDALNRITVASGSADKALDSYGVVLGAAALKHISVSHAAGQVALAYGGNTRALKSLGINLGEGIKLATAAQTADKSHAAALEQLHKAQTKLTQLRERLNAETGKSTDRSLQLERAQTRVTTATETLRQVEWKHGNDSPQVASARARLTLAEQELTKARTDNTTATGLSVSQQQQLTNAEAAVKAAHEKATQAARDQTAAHKAAAGAITTVDQAIRQNQGLVKQADAASDTWTGHLRAFGAVVEDDAAKFGQKYGPAITAAGSAVTALGAGLSITQAVMARLRGSSSAAAAASTEAAAAMRVEGAAAATATPELTAFAAAEDAAAGGAGAAGAGAAARGAGIGLLAGGAGGVAAGLKGLPLYGVGAIPDTKKEFGHTPGDVVSTLTALTKANPGVEHQALLDYVRNVQRDPMGKPNAAALATWRSRYETAGNGQFFSQLGMTSADQLRSLLTSIHMTLLLSVHHQAKTATHTEGTHNAITRSAAGKPLYSPSLGTL